MRIKCEERFETIEEYKEYIYNLAFPKLSEITTEVLNSVKKSSNVYMTCYNFKTILMEICYQQDLGDTLALLMDNKLQDPGKLSYYRFKKDYFDGDYDFEELLIALSEIADDVGYSLQCVFPSMIRDIDMCKHITGIIRTLVINKAKKDKPLEDYSIYEYIEQSFIKLFSNELDALEEECQQNSLDETYNY